MESYRIPESPIGFIKYLMALGRVAIAEKILGMPDTLQDFGGDDE